MSLILYEINKIVIKNKVYVLLLIAIVLRITMLAISSEEVSSLTQKEEKAYYEISQKYAGHVTDDEANYLEGYYSVINQLESYISDLREKYLSGEIDWSEYNDQMGLYDQLSRERNVFINFFRQYRYASEDPDERYIIYTTGWNGLLTVERFDWGFVLLVIVLSALVFGREYESEMRNLLISTKQGEAPLIIAKFICIICLVILLSMLSSLIEYSFFYIKFGLPHGDYPLKSLSYFQDSPFSFTLQGAYLRIFLYRTLGYLVLMVFTIFLSVRLQKTLLPMSISLLIVVLPYALPIVQSIKYILPTPLGLILAQGYFRSTEISEENGYVFFKAIDPMVQSLLILFWIIIFILLTLDIIRRFTSFGFFKRHHFRNIILILITGLAMGFLNSCSGENSNVETCDQVYNSDTNAKFTYVDGRIIWLKDLLYSEDLGTGDIQELIRDPFMTEEEINNQILSIYSCKNNLYYLYKTFSDLKIVQLNLNDFQEKIIYSDKKNDGPELIKSGLFTDEGISSGKQTTPFFVEDHYLYLTEQSLMDASNSITSINLNSGQKKLLIENYLGNIGFTGDQIIYIDNMYQIRMFDIVTKEDFGFQNIRASDLYVGGNKIYFRNIDEGEVIYNLDIESGLTDLVIDQAVGNFIVDGGYLYYVNPQDDWYLYRMDLFSKQIEMIVPLGNGYLLQTHPESPFIIYTITNIENHQGRFSYIKIDKKTMQYSIIE